MELVALRGLVLVVLTSELGGGGGRNSLITLLCNRLFTIPLYFSVWEEGSGERKVSFQYQLCNIKGKTIKDEIPEEKHLFW